MPRILTKICNVLGIPTSKDQVWPQSGTWYQHLLSYLPFFLSACWLFFAVYWDSVLQVVGQKRLPQHQPPLADVGHYYLPWVIVTSSTGVQNVHNIYAEVFGAVTAVRFLFTGRLFIVMLRRFFTIWGCLFILRGTAIAITSYPYTDGTYYPLCQPSLQYGSTTIAQGWWVMFGANATCNDFMVSNTDDAWLRDLTQEGVEPNPGWYCAFCGVSQVLPPELDAIALFCLRCGNERNEGRFPHHLQHRARPWKSLHHSAQ